MVDPHPAGTPLPKGVIGEISNEPLHKMQAYGLCPRDKPTLTTASIHHIMGGGIA